jgi:hypothetical protein
MALDLLSPCLAETTLEVLYDFITPPVPYTAVNFNKWEELIPDDVEDTSLVHFLLVRGGRLPAGGPLRNVARLVLLNVDTRGVIQLYFPPRGGRESRFDPSCISNAMRILYVTGLEGEAGRTEDALYDWLQARTHLTSFMYYPSPDTFLYFLSRAVALSPRAKERFGTLILSRLRERIGRSQFPVDLAMRILTLENLGVLGTEGGLVEGEAQLLLSLQDREEGLWPKDALFKKGRSDTFYGGSHISTIFAVAALRAFLFSAKIDNMADKSLPEA